VLLAFVGLCFAAVPSNIQGTWTGFITYTWLDTTNPTTPDCCPLMGGGTQVPTPSGVVDIGPGVQVLVNDVTVVATNSQMDFITVGPTVNSTCGNGLKNLTVQIDQIVVQNASYSCLSGRVNVLGPTNLGFVDVPCFFTYTSGGNFAIDLVGCKVALAQHANPICPHLGATTPDAYSTPVFPTYCTRLDSAGIAVSEWVTSVGALTKSAGSSTGGGGGGGGSSSASSTQPALFALVAAVLIACVLALEDSKRESRKEWILQQQAIARKRVNEITEKREDISKKREVEAVEQEDDHAEAIKILSAAAELRGAN